MNTQLVCDFLNGLKNNNNREWMQSHKSAYNEARAEFFSFTELMIFKTSRFDSSVDSLDPKDCIFRIHRDIRFSKDKTPYKPFMSAHIVAGGRKSPRAGYYFQIGPDGQTLAGGGLHAPSGDVLKMLRNYITVHGEKLTEIINHRDFLNQFPGGLEGPKLKRPPQGFDADSPYIDFLKFKEMYVMRSFDDSAVLDGEQFAEHIDGAFRAMLPLNTFFNGAIGFSL